ncbi:UbiX family flavin prenyltransferase [Thermogladius sp. 4427co]|uniref:UbiX family flavin prenyltransferase n=1 Tax=Thermogladius sp. 4427co TaxID=3450718 RepID=UPI003F78BE96
MSPRRSDSKLIVGLSGASGILYGLKLLEHVKLAKEVYKEVSVIYTPNAIKVARLEAGVDLPGFLSSIRDIESIYSSEDLDSPLASSSNLVRADMVIIPASMNTIAKISNGIQDNLLTRVAISVLRLGNKLVLVPRETPLSTIDLYNLYKLSRMGSIILPAMPAFYINPRAIDDLILFIVGKVFDVLGIEHSLYKRWGTGSSTTS